MLKLLLTVLVILGLSSAQANDSLYQNYYVNPDAEFAELDKLTSEALSWTFSYEDDTTLQRLIHLNEHQIPSYSDQEISEWLSLIPSEVPLHLTDRVKNVIKYFTLRRREYVTRMLATSQVYFPMFEEVLDRQKMPLELKYLPMIESAFNPHAVSYMGATGIWQIMLPTAKSLGLQVDTYTDERSDPFKATVAATQYLKRMHDIYGDWLLAISAYNAGPGNVNKAIRKSSGKKTFYEIKRFLPKETQKYVPNFVGTVYVMNYYEKYLLKSAKPKYNLFQCDTVHIHSKVSLYEIASATGCDLDYLKFLNPELKKDIAPKRINGYPIRIPIDHVAAFEANKHLLENAPIRTIVENNAVDLPAQTTYRVRSGDNLGAIAQRFGVSVTEIKRWNNLRSSRINIGQKLDIHGASSGVETKKSVAIQEDCNCTYHTIRSGDTLWDISRKYGTTVSRIKNENGLVSNNLKLGKTLKIGL